ncbi:MAG: hypothetical protein NTW19_04050, partial [Planctomycetota bacterium]|nr:hypothetical protein [Planctomycetota bacterium]
LGGDAARASARNEARRRFGEAGAGLDAAREALAREAVARRAAAGQGASSDGSRSGGSAGGRGEAGALQGPHSGGGVGAGDDLVDDSSRARGPSRPSPSRASTSRAERAGDQRVESANATTRPTDFTGVPPELRDLAESYFRRLNEQPAHRPRP